MTEQSGQWRLDQIQLVNWGTFHGLHTMEVSRRGFLLTGHSGSGKSSIVDAITAVLTPTQQASFNAAAADGSSRGNDRSKLTYVRGAYARGADEDTGEVSTQYLRSGATWSGIMLRYSDGANNVRCLVKLLHAKRSTAKPGDLDELHILTHEPVQLMDFEDFATKGIAERALKQAMPQAYVNKSHPRFLARYTRELGIAGERAALLLHKTQSAKNLGSLDDLFRNFMLDEPETFDLAKRAVEQFGELSEAHQAVVTARHQIEHLEPLEEQAHRFEHAEAELERLERLSTARESYTRTKKISLLESARESAASSARVAQEQYHRAKLTLASAEDGRRSAQSLVDSQGGAQLEAAALKVKVSQERLQDTEARFTQLKKKLDSANIQTPDSYAGLSGLQELGRTEQLEHQEQQAARREQVQLLQQQRARLVLEQEGVETETQSMKQRRSNIDHRLIAARELILKVTGLPETALPYAAELLQVRDEYADWTGALERVLRPLGTVMLVPAAHEDSVRIAVDAAHLGTRLKYRVVPTSVERPRAASSGASVVHRIDVAEGQFTAWLNTELSQHYDYTCVETPVQLTDHEQAVTRSGQVKRGRRSYEKDDRRRVNDPSGWILGFDNEAKVEHYFGLLREIGQKISHVDKQLGAAERENRLAQKRLDVLIELQDMTWEQLDVAQRRHELQQAQHAQATLLAQDGDLRAAQHRLEQAQQTEHDARAEADAAQTRSIRAAEGLNSLQTQLDRLRQQQVEELDEHTTEQLQDEFSRVRSERRLTHETIDADSAKVAEALARAARQVADDRHEAQSRIEKTAYTFHQQWPAEAADAVPGVEGRSEYLGILQRLRADRLPEFEQRFFEMLREQSQRNIGLLANRIRSAYREVKARVEPINHSLLRSPFAEGRHLQIRVDLSRPTVAQEFLDDLNSITHNMLAFEEDRHEAEKRFALLDRIMGQLASSDAADRSWQVQCLDTRRHVKFLGLEQNLDGDIVDWHDSGQGRSGGQKQKLVVFCLAAALRYQLTRQDEDSPTYGSIVMDEAFDKSDVTFTRMALNIFKEFGFHMILATPLKMLQVLEEYVGSIALVSCHESRDSHATPVTWEEAERYLSEKRSAEGNSPEPISDAAPDEAGTLLEVH